MNGLVSLGLDEVVVHSRLTRSGYVRNLDRSEENLAVYQKADSSGCEVSYLTLHFGSTGQVIEVAGKAFSVQLGARNCLSREDLVRHLGSPKDRMDLADGWESLIYPNFGLYVVIDGVTGKISGVRLKRNLSRTSITYKYL